jgi:hypothetical protein
LGPRWGSCEKRVGIEAQIGRTAAGGAAVI